MNSSVKYKKIVVITSRFPYPLEKGDKLRAYYQIKELSETMEVTLITLTENKIRSNQLKALSPFCKNIYTFKTKKWINWIKAGLSILGSKPFQVGYFYHTSIHRKINQLIQELKPDHIYAQLIRTTEYVKNYHACPKTIDYMDALSKGMERRTKEASHVKKWIFNLEYQRLVQYENAIFEYFEYHTIISKQDQREIFHKNNNRIIIIPNGVAASFFVKPESKINYDIVFTGNMSYPPNITAAKYIVERILPKLPIGTNILLAGASPSSEVTSLQNNNVTVSGWVDDIRESYAQGRVFIAPMFLGTGLQNKLLEAMALGIPCITSPLANNALGAIDGEQILLADSEATFINHIQFLLSHPEDAKRIAKNGTTFVKDNYDWKATTQKLIDLINV